MCEGEAPAVRVCTALISANISIKIERRSVGGRKHTATVRIAILYRFPHSLWRRLLSALLTPSDQGTRSWQRARARVLCRSLGAASGWLEHWRGPSAEGQLQDQLAVATATRMRASIFHSATPTKGTPSTLSQPDSATGTE